MLIPLRSRTVARSSGDKREERFDVFGIYRSTESAQSTVHPGRLKH